MKRALSLLLALLMLLALAACGGSEADVAEITPTDVPAQEAEEIVEDETVEEEAIEPAAEIHTEFEPVTLADNEDFRLAVQTYEAPLEGFPFAMFIGEIENKNDQPLEFNCESTTVNDRACKSYLSKVGLGSDGEVLSFSMGGMLIVPTGETIDVALILDNEDLVSSGINYIEAVQTSLVVSIAPEMESENSFIFDGDEDEIYRGPVALTVTNIGAAEPATTEVTYSTDFVEIIIVDNDDYTAIIKDYDPAGRNGPEFTLYAENHTDQAVEIQIDNFCINDIDLGRYTNSYNFIALSPGAVDYNAKLRISSLDMEINNIESINTLAFDFVVYAENWESGEILAEERASFALNSSADTADAVITDFEPVIIVDDGEVAAIIENAAYNVYGNFVLTIGVENRTGDDLRFYLDDVSVNDRMLLDDETVGLYQSMFRLYSAGETEGGNGQWMYWVVDVPAGETVTDEIWIQGDLKDTGINYIENVEGMLVGRVMETTAGWMGDTVVSEPFVLRAPDAGDSGPAKEDIIFNNGTEEIVLIDADGIVVVFKDFDKSELGKSNNSFTIYLENNTDNAVNFAIENMLVNGIEYDPYFHQTLPAGKQIYYTGSWGYTDKYTSDIETMETLDFTLVVTDGDGKTIVESAATVDVK